MQTDPLNFISLKAKNWNPVRVGFREQIPEPLYRKNNPVIALSFLELKPQLSPITIALILP
jgi:hypothetical protein